MRSRQLVWIGAFFALAAISPASDAGHLAAYVKALNSAEGLDVTYSINEVGGAMTEYRVVLAKPDKALIVTPSTSYYADGTNITTYNKRRNTYIVRDQSEETIKRLLSEEHFALWRPFFDLAAFDNIVRTKNDGTRKWRGETLKIVSAQMNSAGDYTIRLHLGQRDNRVRQAEFLSTKARTSSTHILSVSSMNTGTPAGELFAFVAPANAKQLSEMDLRAEAIASIVVFAPSEGRLADATYKSVQPQNADLADTYYEALIEEFSKYPIDFMVASKLKKIVLVEQLVRSGLNTAAYPALRTDTLYYDVTFIKSEMYARSVIHHEFFHMIDEAWNGADYRTDPKWSALNLSGFRYGAGGGAANRGPNRNSMFALSHTRPGFASNYALSGLEEDKAVIWAAMFVYDRWTSLKKLIAVDSIIGAKVAFLREAARSKSPEMEGEYWEIVAAER